MELFDEKKLIVEKLSNAIPEAVIETQLQRLFTEPEGKVVVMYNSSPYSKTEKIPYQSRVRVKRWSISITTRDPLNEDIALKYLEKIRIALHGLRVGFEDQERLYPDNERFEEFIEGSEVYAYKIDFISEQTVFMDTNNQ